jgi:hypothetical protein
VSSTDENPERTSVSRGELLWVLGLFVVLAAIFPYFEEIHSANELSRLYLATAIVEDGTVAIDGPLQRLGDIHDKSVRDGHFYSDKAPGMAFAVLPALWLYNQLAGPPLLADAVRLGRFVASTLPTGIFFVVLLYFLAEHLRDRRLRLLLVTGYAFGTLATTYGILLFGHQLSAILLFGTYLAIRRTGPGSAWWRPALVGLLASAAVLTEYQNALYLVPMAVFFVWRVRLSPRALAVGLVGMAPLTALLLYYHELAFGSPLRTGYSFIASGFAAVHEQGFMGIGLPRPSALALSLFAPRKGLFFFSPFLLLALPGLFVVGKRGADGVLAVLMTVMYVAFVSGMVYPDGGWTVSQRHLTPLVPWLLLPVGVFVERVRAVRPVLAGLLVVSVVVTGVSTVVWPHYMEVYTNPFFQLGWPLFRDGWLPPSTFGRLGVSTHALVVVAGAAVLQLVVVDLVLFFETARARAAALGVATLLVAGWFGATRHLGAELDGRAERAYVERVYQLDPVVEPLARPARW